MKVLIIEDEADTQQLLKSYFLSKEYEVVCAGDGLTALDLFRDESPDFVLLDVRIPHLDGWGVLENIRSQSKVPVIMLTAMDSVDDVVKGLTLGADDYLRKPFQFSELDARIQSVLRRLQHESGDEILSAGPCRIDDRAKTVTLNGAPVSLSPKEYDLLKLLVLDPGRVFSNQEIIARIWPSSHRANANDVKQYIHLLRNKIEEDPSKPSRIETVKGFGYRLVI